MSLVDQFLEKYAGYEREDKGEQNWKDDLQDSIGSGIFGLDNVVNQIDGRISTVDEKLEEADEKLAEAEEMLEKVIVMLKLVEVQVIAGFLLISLISYYYLDVANTNLLKNFALVIIFMAIVDLIALLYRLLYYDFLLDLTVKLKSFLKHK